MDHTWYQWLLMFYIFSFFGWIFESAYVSIRKRRFVNRGFLRLPMLPLYGTGAVLLLWLTLPFRENLFLVYIIGVIAATVLEYVTGWAMERLFKVRYWDYSDQRFQVNGYICLSSSIAWGFLTIFLTEVIDKPISRLLLWINPAASVLCCAAVSVLFGIDTVGSVRAALNLAKVLEAMTRMQSELDELQVQMALLKLETRDRMERAKDNAVLRMELLKAQAAARAEQLRQPGELMEDTAQRLSATMEERAQWLSAKVEEHSQQLGAKMEEYTQQLGAKMEERAQQFNAKMEERAGRLGERLTALSDKRRDILSNMDFYRRGLLRGNPSATSKRFGKALKELREAAWGQKEKEEEGNK